ncbi:MAG: hypothetical protein V7677_14230 [Motiliproteus sp.]
MFKFSQIESTIRKPHRLRRLLFAWALILSLPIYSATAVHAPATSTVAAPTYPRTIELPEGKVEIHMPQVESWDDYEVLTLWIAMNVTPLGSEKSWIGTAKVKAKSDIDFDTRLVIIHDIEIIDRKFQDDIKPPEAVLEIARTAFSLKSRSVPLDVVLRALPEDFKPTRGPGPSPQLNPEPPRIFVATSPTALMIINGDLVKAPIKETQLEFVVNTNWDLFFDKQSADYYVLNETTWQRTRSLDKPEWIATRQLPGDFSKIPASSNWQAVKKHIPPRQSAPRPPQIIVSFEPAELIQMTGSPMLLPIEKTGIEWVKNTSSDLFNYQQTYYYLVSGRWFKSTKLTDKWQAVETLPAAFAEIPELHPKAHVLASVPGTSAARVAIIEASIPRKARINTDAGAGIEVIYDGDPKFVAIEGTNMQRAANTQFQVIRVKGRYYLCHNAVWFTATSATGPWEVATSVPKVIYTIPASDPAHNVTYVYIYEDPGATTYVTYAYSSGYYGYYAYGTTVVYGSGWYYPPYYYYDPIGYPAYWYYPPSYGYDSWYNPTTGRYGERSVAYGPYGGTAAGSVYNPRTGAYARGSTVWDSDEVARSGYAYNPNTNAYAAGNMYYDFDDNKGWREGYVERGDRWVYGETDLDHNTARTEYQTSRGVEGTSQRTRGEDSVTGSGTINYQDHSAQTSSRIDSEGAQLDIQGDQGGSATITKDRGDTGATAELTGRDGRTAQAQSSLTEQGRNTTIEGSAGGQAHSTVNESGRSSVGRSQSGDLYAGKNGNVYKRNDGGSWSNYQNGSWQDASAPTRQSKPVTSQRYKADRNSLNRHYSARQQGSRNYDRFQSQNRFQSRGRIQNRPSGRARGTSRGRRR